MTRLPHGLCCLLQVMKLAVQHKLKALTFVSSVGVAGPLGITEIIRENALGADLATESPASGGYAYGCAATAHEPSLLQELPAWETCAPWAALSC